MEGYQFSHQSDYVKKIISVVEDRDERIYNLDKMEHWTNQNIRDFIIAVNHEILREILELEHWMKSVLDEAEAISINLSKFSDMDEQVTVKDAIQLSMVKLRTMKKILTVMKKYADIKHSNENKTP
jgi:hypothetical protein